MTKTPKIAHQNPHRHHILQVTTQTFYTILEEFMATPEERNTEPLVYQPPSSKEPNYPYNHSQRITNQMTVPHHYPLTHHPTYHALIIDHNEVLVILPKTIIIKKKFLKKNLL